MRIPKTGIRRSRSKLSVLARSCVRGSLWPDTAGAWFGRWSLHGHRSPGAFGSWFFEGFEDLFFSGFAWCWQHVRTGLEFCDSSAAALGSVSRSKVQQHHAGPASVPNIRYAINPTRNMTSPKVPWPYEAREFISYYRLRSRENQCEPTNRRFDTTWRAPCRRILLGSSSLASHEEITHHTHVFMFQVVAMVNEHTALCGSDVKLHGLARKD